MFWNDRYDEIQKRKIAWDIRQRNKLFSHVSSIVTPKKEDEEKKDDKPDLDWTCKNNIYEFLQNSSMHGLGYIGDTSLHICERLFWCVMFILAVLAAVYFITNLFVKYQEIPVIQSLSPTTTALQEIPFPAITLCNMNNVKSSKAKEILKGDNVVEKALVYETCGMSHDLIVHGNDTENWDVIEDFLYKVTQPCFTGLVHCSWHGESYPCTQIFQSVLTDEGMCCSFNKVPAKFMYRNPKGMREITSDNDSQVVVYDPIPSIDWNPETGYPPGISFNRWPWRGWGPGTSNGLSVVLDIEIDEYFCSSESSVGFKVLLHNSVENPNIGDFGTLIEPGLETRVVINPIIYSASSDIESIERDKRKCFFMKERYLRYYRTYTQKNCMKECQANFTLEMCGCVLNYMPKGKATPICNKHDEECVAQAFEKYKMIFIPKESQENSTNTKNTKAKSKNKNSVSICNCYPGCFEIGYSMQQTSGQLSHTLDIKPSYLANKSKQYFEENMAVVHFFFAQSQFTATQRGALYGFTEFVSNTGGLLGLFMGFSILSLVEILYYLSIRVFVALCRKKCYKIKENSIIPVNRRAPMSNRIFMNNQIPLNNMNQLALRNQQLIHYPYY